MATANRLLVERGEQLEQMTSVVDRSRKSGAMLFVSGEAGHGKSTLIDAWLSGLDHRYRLLLGACDPVSVPTPFAPLYEMLDQLPASLSGEIRDGEGRQAVFTDFLRLMETEPTVLVIEDAQWADEATLGLVRYLGRRLERTRGVLAVSYRPEEIDPSNPILMVLADLGPVATYVNAAALTVDGVRQLCAGSDLDPEQVHAISLGNPFFVEEILANPEEILPTTIEAAVLASVGKLPTGALDLLEMVALSPEGLDIAIAERLSPEIATNIDTTCQRRLLVEDRGRLRCRHDLIRLAVDASIPPARRRRVHLRLLQALEQEPRSRRDMARLAHHSVRAGEAGKAIEHSLAAAAIAEADGANRQARLHYDSALLFKEAMDRETLDWTLLAAANVHCATNHLPDASAAARERVSFAEGDVDLGERLAWSAFFAARWGNEALARQDATEALGLLDPDGPTEARTRALSVLAALALWEADWSTAFALALQVKELAERMGSAGALASALLGLGRSGFFLGDPQWEDRIEEAARLGLDSGTLETACSALNSLAYLAMWSHDIEGAKKRFKIGMDFASAHEMDAWYVAMAASKAECDMAQGRWDEAAEALERAAGWPTCDSTDCETALLMALLRSRRGDQSAGQAVADALDHCDRVGTYSERVLAGGVALEAAWLGELDTNVAVDRYEKTLAEADSAGDRHAAERLTLWASIVGALEATDVESRARVWSDRGFAYESQVLAAMSPAPDLHRVFDVLGGWGAEGVLRALRRDLKARGIHGIPRGVRPSTADNPAGLTQRQVDVLLLLAEGQTNGSIAANLFISEKTVGHHVSAILDKLAVENRVQAAAVAAERGLI